MKKNVLSRAFSLFLALLMVLGTVPVTVISAYAEGTPEMLVTSLTELYSGDETRAREDLEALSAAGLLGADGKLVALDIRENGESVQLSALAERIANGETVGEITVNGNAATTAQIVQIQSVQSAIELAQLLDEDIDVTDEHVENLEGLLTGLQNGTIDLETALKTGALSVQSASSPAMLAGTGDLPETIQSSTLPAENKLPVSAEKTLYLMDLNEDGTGYVAPYYDSTGFDAEHVFTFENQDLAYKSYAYEDKRYNGHFFAHHNSDDYTDWYWNMGTIYSESTYLANKTDNGYDKFIDWDHMQWGVGEQDGRQVLTIVLPFFTTDEAQTLFANTAVSNSLRAAGNNATGVELALPQPYGTVTAMRYMPNMYFTFCHSQASGFGLSEDEVIWSEHFWHYGYDNYTTWADTARFRYPAYVIEKDGIVVGLATCMAVRPNASSMIRRDKVNLYMDASRDTFAGPGNMQEYAELGEYTNVGNPYVPEWNDVLDKEWESKYGVCWGYERRVDDSGFSYFYYYPFRSSPYYPYLYVGELNPYVYSSSILEMCPRARRVVDLDLYYYVAPSELLDKTKYTDRTAAYEPAEGGFIKLTNPENADFPYVYPGDPAHPENQYDLELLATEDLYQLMIGGGVVYMEKGLDLRFAWQFSNRANFAVKEVDFSAFSGGFMKYDQGDEGEAVLTATSASEERQTIGLTVTNDGVAPYDVTFPTPVAAREGADPYLMIPRSSQIRETLTDLGTNIFFASNITQQNQSDTKFITKLYRIDEDQIGQGVPEGAAPITVAGWGEFPSTIGAPVTSIPVPGTALTKAGAYAVTISAELNNGEKTIPFSVTAYLKVKNAPAKITLNPLESYSVVKGSIPALRYTVTSRADNVEVEYTVQSAGGAVSERMTASGGTIPFDPGDITATKKAYTITVYARNAGDEAWSADSMLLTVYSENPVKLVVKDVPFGEIGGTTGGVATGSPVTSVTMDNHDRVEWLITQFQNNVTGYSFDELRAGVNLQKLISANYGNGTMGVISDKLQWSAKEADGTLSDDVTLNYQENGAYSDISSYNYTYYIPTSDFLVAATDDKSGDAPVTITAIHAATGLPASVQVTVNTLKDQFFMIRFDPKAETEVIYTTGKGEERKLKTNAQGELAVYEPDGITGEIMAMSTTDDATYIGTFDSSELVSGEQNAAKLEVYPCTTFTLRKVSDCTLTFRKPDGTPYVGKVTIRGGVYAGREYCPDARMRTEKDLSAHQYLREDVEFTTGADGKTTVYFDPTQFVSESGKTWARGLQYVFEYRFDNSYQPGYVIINAAVGNPAETVVTMKTMRGSGNTPTIVRQDYRQFMNGTTPTSYTRNVMDYTENIGISPNFGKAELYTDIVMLGEEVQTNAKGYATYTGDNAMGFALYTTDGKKLTGQNELTEAKTITNLNELNSATYFVFPFSKVPMLRSTYVMNNANLTADGITDEGARPTPTARIKAVFTRGGMTVKSVNMPFGVTNVFHQPNLNSNQGATAVGKEVKGNLKETTDIGAIFRSINVNDMIRKGFVFLGNLAGAGGDTPINMMILPTQDPATFRIIAFVGANQRPGDDDEGVSVNLNAKDLAEDMNKFKKEMDDLNKKKDKDNDSNGEGSMQFNFYGTIILEAHAGVADGKWSIAFRGGNVGTNVKGKYEWGQTFMCGPYPAFISFEVGFHADLEVAFGNKGAARAMLLDAALGVSVEAFAGLGFDLSIVALQLGIYGQIGADVNFLLLTPSNDSVKTGTKLTISGEIGIKLKVKLLFISYSKKFASTGFSWTKKWNKYDQIKQYWSDQGFAQLFGTTRSGRAYTMYLYDDGSTIVEIDGGAELESRDYLELSERAWTGGISLMRAAGPMTGALTNVQTNAYPYSHPAFTDDGELFLYISDNDNAQTTESVASYAVKSGDGYVNMARVDTSEDNVLADLDVVASGTKTNAFAAWVKQVETPQMEKRASVTNDDIGMMFNATEVYAASYNGTAWTTERLTENYVADMSPTVASSGSKAIVAWRSMNAATMPESGVQDITAAFNVENNINYRIYNGTEWTTAQVAYNGNAGTVNAIDSAMLPDGTAILTYTVRTDEDVTTTETFYTVIGADGAILTTGRLTNDSYTDTNAQVTAVNEDGGYFVLGWYSEHDAGEGTTAAEYDADGNVTATKAVVAHDIRLARINANGSYDIDFPESIGGTGDTGISSDFRFSAPANNTALTNVAVVWSQRKDSDAAEDAGKYELNAVRFYETGDVTGLTATADMAETTKNFAIDHFDAYTDGDGAVHTIILGSDYDSIKGISVYDSIDLDSAAGNTVESNSAEPNNLDILDGEAISYLKLAKGTFPRIAADVTADMDIDEVRPGFTMPVQFTVTNTGTDKLNAVTATVGSQSKEFTGLNLLPNQSATLLMTYSVPEGAVSDPAYSATSDGTELGSGTLTLNRPDVGISGVKILRESDGTRDIQVTLSNNSSIPLAGSGKTVKLALYKDPFHENRIGEEATIPADVYADIDEGTYAAVQTFDVTSLYSGTEIPKDGLTVYVRAWVEETEEPDVYNNDSFISFSGLLARNNGEKLTIDTSLAAEDGSYTVYVDIRNNSMQEQMVSVPVAVLLDENGAVIAHKNLQDTDLVLTKEHLSSLSATFSAEELGGRIPAMAELRHLYKVNFNLNGGSGEFATIRTDHLGHIAIPENVPQAPAGNRPLFFRGWYTGKTGGEMITEDTVFTKDSTIYARYTEHEHVFTCTVNADDTVTVKCVSTVDDICPLEEQGRTATLKILPPERVSTGYGMPNATISGAKGVVNSPKILYYNADNAGNKVGEALSKAPLNAGKYRAEFTIGKGENSATIHVVYEIPAIEGLSFSEVSIPEYVRTLDPTAINNLTNADGIAALAWIYANEDTLRSDDPWDDIPKFIVYGKRYITRPEGMPEDIEWPYDDNTEYALCYRVDRYDCNQEPIPVGELQSVIASRSGEVYIPGTGSMELQTDAAFISINNREELSGGMNPCTELDALLWILENGEKYQNGGFIMLSQRNEYECSSIEFHPGFARVQSSDLGMVFDMHEGEGMPIFVRQISNVLSPNTSYNVTFDANGGEGSVSGGGKYYVKSKIELPDGDGLTKPNLVFDGWNTKADGTGDAYKSGDKFEVLENTTFYAQWKHVHNWTVTYNEETHVYTATCGVWGCPNSTVTMHPEAADKTYDGKNATPYSNADFWTEENGLPVPTVTFYQNDAEVSEAKNVGTYTALVSLDGHENSVGEFQITPRPVTVTADDLSKHEGEEEPALTVSYAPVGASLRFENDETYPWQIVTEGDRVYAKSGNGGKGDTTSTLTLNVTLSEAGTISFDYTSQGEGSSWDVSRFYIDSAQKFQYGEGPYDWQTCSYELPAGTHTLSWAYSKDGGTDNRGDCFTVDNVVITTPGEVTQAEPEEKPDDTVPFECLVADLGFKNDASYPWVEVTEDDRTFVKSGNAGAGDTTSTLTLNVTLAEAGKVSFDYKHETEEGYDKCYFVVDGSDLFEKSGKANWQTYSTKLSAGSHTLTWRYTKDGGSDEGSDIFAIDNLVFTTEGEVKQEDPSLALIPALNKFEGGIVEGETLHYTIARATGETMGTYDITVTMGDNPNYDVREVTGGTFTILESLGVMQTITADDVTATYGDTGLKINAAITEGDGTLSYEVKSGDAVTVDAQGNLTIVKAGTAVISVVASKTDEYARTTKSVNVTINPKAMTVSTGNVNATANGRPVGIAVTVTDPAEGYTVKYGTTEGTYNLSASPTLTEAGTMTVYYQVTADNYETFTGSATLTLVNHSHEMAYTAGTGENANTITAVCASMDCPLPNRTATLTISGPGAISVYDGAAHPAVITDENGIRGDAKVLYAAKGENGTYGIATETAPVDAGTYKASITLGTGEGAATVSVEYVITCAELTDVSVAQTGTMTYTGSAQTPQVTTAAKAVNNRTVTFTYSKTENGTYGAMPTFTDVADAGTVYFKATAPNHKPVTGSFTVTMSKADRSAPAAPTLHTAAANAITLTAAEGCQYSMDGVTWQDEATFTGLQKNTEYTFYQRLKATGNYNASPASEAATLSTTDHDHQWSFQGTGATITATCGNTDGGHGTPLTAALTINAPALTTYGETGKSANATITGSIDGVDTPAVVYKQGGTALTATPTDAGTYTASITVGTATASVAYTIAKATMTDVSVAQTGTMTYTGSAQTPQVAAAATVANNQPVTFTYSLTENGAYGDMPSFTTVADAGTVYFKATAPNHEPATGSFTVTMNKANQTAPAAPTKADATINSITLTAIANGEYSKDGNTWQESATFTGLTMNTEYTFYQRLKADDNHNASPASQSASIRTSNHAHEWVFTAQGAVITATCGNGDKGHSGELSATMTITAPTLTVYGGTGSANVTVTNGIEGVGIPSVVYKQGETALTATPTDAGTYTASITVGTATASVTYTIAKKAVTVTADHKSKTYGESDPAFTATNTDLVGSDTLNYTLSRAEGENVGEYTISVVPGENPNYEVTTVGAKLTIHKKAASITADSKTKTYGDADPVLTATATDLVGSDTLNYTLTRAEGENVGEYAITVTPGENPNYDVSVVGAKLTINKKAASVTANSKTKTYGDANPALTATVVGTVGTDTLNYTLSRAEGENVGDYTITVTLGDNPNYNVTAANSTFTITKKAASVTAVNTGKIFHESEPALTATVEGTVGTDALNYTLSRAKGEEAGEYTISVALGNNPNYDVTAIDGVFTVAKKAATITVANLSKVYGEDDPALTATVEGTVGEDTLDYTLSRTQGNNAGEYVITATPGNNPNYDVTVLNGIFTILKKSADVVITPHNAGKVYGEADPGLSATVTGLVGDDTLRYTLSRSGGEDAGEYSITVHLGENPNYEVATLRGIFTISKKSVTITADNLSKVFGEDDPALTATAANVVGGDTLNYTLSRAEGENAGEYRITVHPGNNPNYDVTAVGGKLTITKAAPAPAALTEEKIVYNGTRQALVSLAGTVTGGKVMYALSTNALAAPEEGWSTEIPTETSAGTYYVWYKVMGDENHTDAEPVCVEVTIAADYGVASVNGLSGANEDQWTKSSDNGLAITMKPSGEEDILAHFVGVKLDGNELVRDVDYTIGEDGSGVTLQPETLATLAPGKHTVTIVYDNGEADTTFTVSAADSHVGLWIAAAAVAVAAIVIIILLARKKKANEK